MENENETEAFHEERKWDCVIVKTSCIGETDDMIESNKNQGCVRKEWKTVNEEMVHVWWDVRRKYMHWHGRNVNGFVDPNRSNETMGRNDPVTV